MKSLCVFCGSSPGADASYKETAVLFGKTLAENNITLIYGGANIGVMGAVASACMDNGGSVIGIMPESLMQKEIAHPGITELISVDSMHERKQKMYDLSDAFLALPGGMGTLDEFCEIMTWAQLNYHQKPCYLFNQNGFYSHLIAHFNYVSKEGFLSAEHLALVQIVDSVHEFWEIAKTL